MNERPFASSVSQLDTLTHLRWRWGGVAALWLAAWLAGYLSLRPIWPDAARWGLLAAPLLGYGLWVVWRRLPLNHRPGETQLLPTLGLGTGLTLFRGLAVALIAGFLFSPWPAGWLAWLPMLLYTAADIADFLDGYVARRRNHATLLGAQLDMEFDGLGMLVVSLLAVWYGQLPAWYLLLGLARYLFVLGIWWRRRRGLPLHPMPDSTHRRVFAGFQMGFMSAVLWPIVPPAGATIAGTIFAAATAVSFLRDWLVTIGRLNPRSAGYRRARRRLVRLARRTLPPLLRVALLVSAAALAAGLPRPWPPAAWVALLTGWGLPAPAALAVLATGVLLLGALLVAAGVLGRLTSLLLVFPIGFDIVTQQITWANGIALACVIMLMLLGTGPYSLWQPEERVVLTRMGA